MGLGSGGAAQVGAAQRGWTGSALPGQPEAAVAELSGGRSGGIRRALRDSARSGSGGATAGREGTPASPCGVNRGWSSSSSWGRSAMPRAGEAGPVRDARAPLVPVRGPEGAAPGPAGPRPALSRVSLLVYAFEELPACLVADLT